jgi:hypothetical protein
MAPQLPTYPGHLITVGKNDQRIVEAIQRRLNETGCGPISVTTVYDAKTRDAVKLYQSRFTDRNGMPLKIDGIVGPITWAALFDSEPVVLGDGSPLMTNTLDVASTQLDVREIPPGSNAGPQVEQYLASVDCRPGDAWCAAFVYWCFNKAAKQMGITNPVVKTGGVLDHWNKAGRQGIRRILTADISADQSLLKRGLVFIISTGGGKGHTGLVGGFEAGKLITIEGNTNDGGDREGIGVFRRAGGTGRKLADINKGFIDYGDAAI